MEVRLTLAAGMLMDRLPKQDRAKVARALQRLSESETWDDARRHSQIKHLRSGTSDQRVYAYRASPDIRVIFTIVGSTVHVLDIVRPDQLKNLTVKQTSGASSE